MIIRKASIEDINILIELRIDFFTENRGNLTKEENIAIRTQLSGYFEKHIQDQTLIAALAETDNQILATAFLVITEKPAGPAFLTGKIGTLLNVLTYPDIGEKASLQK